MTDTPNDSITWLQYMNMIKWLQYRPQCIWLINWLTLVYYYLCGVPFNESCCRWHRSPHHEASSWCIWLIHWLTPVYTTDTVIDSITWLIHWLMTDQLLDSDKLAPVYDSSVWMSDTLFGSIHWFIEYLCCFGHYARTEVAQHEAHKQNLCAKSRFSCI